MSDYASIGIPRWDGHAYEVGEAWRLTKDWRVAVCALWTHPKGGEVRVTIDGEWQRGEARNDGLFAYRRSQVRLRDSRTQPLFLPH